MKRLEDLRFVIGLFFAILGAILLIGTAFGLNDLVEGVHLNLIAGSAMGAFGALMLLLATVWDR